MSNEISTEVLAKAINETKDTVQTNDVDIELRINGEKEKFKLIHKSASNDNNQLNAMAIAPVKADGKPDYDNVAGCIPIRSTRLGRFPASTRRQSHCARSKSSRTKRV